ncbi:hypothetical protein B9Z55_027639 [Caenorhabditis nigoni]|uniref:Uncharacterized protein n=2 Tax=Caenorhabditis nigoni TaxID=1611254 RepID=A0A2G5SF12_9PELO|nr:hypothetical protein B9Z55_027639 [Caenorhabditis nigoni]
MMRTETKSSCVIFKYNLRVSFTIMSNAGMHERIRQSDEKTASRSQNVLEEYDSEPKISCKLFSNVKAYIKHTDN